MKDDELQPQDLAWLARFANDETTPIEDAKVLARLEASGFLMRGWGGAHVVTETGRAALKEIRLEGRTAPPLV